MDNKYKFEKLDNNVFVCVSDQHKFGTDAFLLTYFSKQKNEKVICDFGTGCGIIPLILQSRKYNFEKIYGIDIQKQAIEQFNLSLEKSNLSKDKFICINNDIKNIKEFMVASSVDLVISNPPYKSKNSGILSLNPEKQIANHEVLCNINDICNSAKYVLKDRGRLCICQRPERLPDIITAMRENKIEPKILRLVTNEYNSPPWLLLIEGIKNARPFMKIEKNLIINDNGKYSEEMMKVYNIN